MKFLSSVNKFIKTGLVVATVLTAGAIQFPGNASANVSLGGAQDCDANAVIYCGAQTSTSLINQYNKGNSQNSAKSIQDIFAKFGIDSAEVNALNTTAVAGRVTKTGEVYINSSATAVATNALTVGRQNMPGSKQVSHNGTTMYTRTPGVSFRSSSLPAYVVMKDGVFQFAIIGSCANPVIATPKIQPKPQTTPKTTINKTVAVKGSETFVKNVTVKSGSSVVYKIEVKSTGTETATNVVVKDVLPANATYTPGTLVRGAARVTDAQATSFFSTSGINVGSVAVGQTIIFRFEATIGQSATDTSCRKETITNTGTVTATNVPAASSTAGVVKECETVTPVVVAPVCNNFEIVALENRTIRVTKVDYTANGATFVNAVINWDVNKTNDSTAAITNANDIVGQTHQYTADGAYLVGVTITFTQDGKTVAVNGPECQKQVAFTTATPTVVTPAATPPPVVTPAATPPTPAAAPVSLVAAGAGSTAALFAAVAAIAGGVYHWSLRRRLSL